MAENQTLFRRELDKSILSNIKQKIYNYLKANGLSNVDEVMNRMNLVQGLYVENLVESHGPKMVSRGNPNEIAIDVQFVEFDKNNNPIGLNPKLAKLIESQLGHELLHSGARNGKTTGIMNTNNGRGLNEGLTQLITENIFGYTVSKNTDGYTMLKKFAKILEASFGKKCILEAYFNDDLILKQAMDSIKPRYYNIFNKCLSSANSCKGYDLTRFYELLMRDLIINLIIPTMKTKTPDDANRYIKNIAVYFKDDYKIAMDFLSYVEEYKKMDDSAIASKKSYVERDIDKEYARMGFYQECLKSRDINSLIKIDSLGNVTANYDGKKFMVTNSRMLEIIFAKYYEQVIIDDSNRLANVDKKIEERLENRNDKITFSDKKMGDIVYKKSVLAYYKKVASKKGIRINNDIQDVSDVPTIDLDMADLEKGNPFNFNELKDALEKYSFTYPDLNNPQRYEIVDNKTGKVVENVRIKKIVAFAYLWLSSFGYKWIPGEKYNGYTYAFSENAEEMYNEMCKIIQKSMSEHGTINVKELCEKLEIGRSFDSVHTPIETMFKNPMSTDIVYNYFKALIPKNRVIVETETTKIYNSSNVDYQGAIEARVDKIVPSNNKSIYEELYRELARDNMPNNGIKNNREYYKIFVAAADAVANAISIDNDVLIAEAMTKLDEAEKNIDKVDIKNLDPNMATEDQLIQQSLARMKRALRNKDIDGYNMYRDRYNSIIEGKKDALKTY